MLKILGRWLILRLCVAREGPLMLRKYPVLEEVYDSRLYPGQQCVVDSVIEAQVTIRWVGQYAHIEPQAVPVNRFILDFVPAPFLPDSGNLSGRRLAINRGLP